MEDNTLKKITVSNKVDEAICSICTQIEYAEQKNTPAIANSLAKLLLAREQINRTN